VNAHALQLARTANHYYVKPKFEMPSTTGNPPYYDVLGQRYYVKNTSQGYIEEGIASWYGTDFHGKTTSSGEIYNMYAMTAAHKELPIPCYARVTNLENGQNIIVKINDRGPFHSNRIIDLSYSAAVKLGMITKGTTKVSVTALPPFQTLTGLKQFDTPPMKHLYMQLGAFSQQSNAQSYAQRLEKVLNKPVSIFKTIKEFTTFYHVKIGPFANLEEAERFNHKVTQAGLNTGLYIYL